MRRNLERAKQVRERKRLAPMNVPHNHLRRLKLFLPLLLDHLGFVRHGKTPAFPCVSGGNAPLYARLKSRLDGYNEERNGSRARPSPGRAHYSAEVTAFKCNK